MYKIKSSVGEVRNLCIAYMENRKFVVKSRRVEYIHKHINDKNIFGKNRYKSVKDVIRYMKKTEELFGTIWTYCWVSGSYWEKSITDLFNSIKNLPDDREIWLQEELSFLFKYKEKE